MQYAGDSNYTPFPGRSRLRCGSGTVAGSRCPASAGAVLRFTGMGSPATATGRIAFTTADASGTSSLVNGAAALTVSSWRGRTIRSPRRHNGDFVVAPATSRVFTPRRSTSRPRTLAANGSPLDGVRRSHYEHHAARLRAQYCSTTGRGTATALSGGGASTTPRGSRWGATHFAAYNPNAGYGAAFRR